MEAIRLKRVIIREEIFRLTKDTFEAIILGQLIYWQERVKDFDKFILEERERSCNEGKEPNIELLNGWIYKSSKDLIEECMLTVSINSMRRYLQSLLDKGFISCRNSPNNKWDKRLQYRVNITFIISEIQKMGYDGLSGYSLLKAKTSTPIFHTETSNCQIDKSNIHPDNSDSQIDKSNDQFDKAITENIIETTNDVVVDARARELSFDESDFVSKFLSPEKAAKIQTLCMNLHVSEFELRRLVGEVWNEWQVTEKKHESYNDAARHMVSQVRIKLNEKNKSNGNVSFKQKEREDALAGYQRALDYCDEIQRREDEQRNRSGNL